MRKEDGLVSDYRGPFIVRGIQIIFISGIIIVALLVSVWNALGLKDALNRRTQEYLNDKTSQMTGTIHDSIQFNIDSLLMIADSVGQIRSFQEGQNLQEFLERKARILDFDSVIQIDREGGGVSSNPDSSVKHDILCDLPSVQASFEGEVCTSYLGGQEIFYSVPVYVQDEVSDVIVGIRSKESMQEMIDSKSFDGRTLSCIIDSSGQVVLSPSDLKPFLQLDDLFKSDQDGELALEIENMGENMEEGKEGILEFASSTQEDLFLSYNSLGVNDWFLLTIIPNDLISGGSEAYILRFYLILGFMSLVFLAFIIMVFHLFNESRRRLEHFAFLDDVTGGMNNAAFQLKYREASQSMKPFSYTIVMLDVKGFKLVNEMFGIDGGNHMLSYIYEVIRHYINAKDNEFVARSESDHFFLCMKECEPVMIQTRLNQIIKEVNAFRNTDVSPFPVVFQQGACIINDPGQEITILQDRTRIAYQSMENESCEKCIFYDDIFAEKIKKEQELNALFEESLKNNDFQVYLQPKISTKDSMVAGAEALVRWVHPQKGMIFPSDFIPLFEKNGKICRLDLYMFESVCRLIDDWRNRGRELVPISVNLSRQHFQYEGYLEPFAKVARKYNIPEGIIELELTESTFFDDKQINIVKEGISQMHKLGFKCSLDDFGSGFSSLGLLKEFDVDVLKLDRRFFLDMSRKKAKDVISCLIELAAKLHVKTVAEGIEELWQVEYLRRVNCDMIQGYVYSKPLPVNEFERWTDRKQQA